MQLLSRPARIYCQLLQAAGHPLPGRDLGPAGGPLLCGHWAGGLHRCGWAGFFQLLPCALQLQHQHVCTWASVCRGTLNCRRLQQQLLTQGDALQRTFAPPLRLCPALAPRRALCHAAFAFSPCPTAAVVINQASVETFFSKKLTQYADVVGDNIGKWMGA